VRDRLSALPWAHHTDLPAVPPGQRCLHSLLARPDDTAG